ncbi:MULTISPECIES: uroporphyrinogen-III C-methyltransferase [unclassified Modicisalibacter]|uniref:uroporphyrinogen-III C-methyltransferase n=1 Tax=unclassified Modicisalibacter TaxID=2679913 RepID=UPI001CCDE747|nr:MULTISPECIES: uroporphyrinogen-III C-methyltransferase [unclassified Modicisalibacter]MBZ9558878.1 uroporphyrinogen-III C-methyltransferase [Modicisalibacter sp. R2A 31.J]MBZ9575230.1 uroporphyrinogen-III C-methyltransferase [Modicisalibacter sp. MOD 31.J]
MSKQEHDQDDSRAPSGAGKAKAGGDAKPAGETPATTAEDGSRRASSERGRDKAAASDGEKAGSRPQKTGGEAAAKADDAAKRDNPKGSDAQGGKASPSGQSNAQSGGNAGRSGGKPAESPRSASGTTPPAGGKSAASGGDSRGGGGKLGGIALVLVILLALVVVAGGWWGWQRLESQQQRLAQSEQNAQAIDELKSQFGQRDQQREQALQSIRSDFQQYRQQMNDTLDKVLDQLASKQQTDTSEWRYAEVEYLLRLANQRLQLERDVKGAISLLQTADKRLAQIDNPALTPVRRSIQSELGELQSVPQVDRTGLYLELMAQQEQLAKLPLQQDIQQQAAEAGDTSPVSGGWKQQLSRFGQELKDLVVIRKHDQALEALITPEQESYLRQNVRLQLEQAQLALLQSDPKLYRASLDKARSLIQGYYDTDSQGVTRSLDTLASLKGKTIRPELPDISDSLQQLRDFMERRHDAGSGAA